MSFYSPIDRLAQNLPRPKGTGSEFMTELSKMPGYKSQEAEDRGLQALMNLPKMERAQFLEALKNKPPVTPETRMLQTPHHEHYTLPGGENYREFVLRHPQGKFQGVPHHFGGVSNILASVRAKDRTGPNGEKILHLEEIQSDWHQQGREAGYLNPKEEHTAEEKKYGVPDAPFKKNWHEMALKKMIHHAAKNGYDSIAITPGAEQAKRYGLNQHVGSLLHDKEDSSFVVRDPNGEVIHREAGVSPERIKELVGKETAEKLMQSPVNSSQYMLRGKDLEFGGSGMKGFYDKMIPSFLNQFGKKYGAKVGQGQINIDDPNGHSQTEMLRASGIPEQNWGQLSYPQKQQMMAEYSAKQPPKMAPVHTFPITPEMREDVVKNGVPLYAKGGEVSRETHDANLAKFLAESKVKDRLYHGTDKDFSEFKFNPKKSMGTWLTNRPKLASAYSEVSARGGDNSAVYPLYAQIKNPASEKDFMDARDIAQAQSAAEGWHDHTIRHKQLLLDKGFDGVKLKDGTYIAFEPTQIKSATGNRGTYDPNDRDITKAKGGSIKPVGYTKERVTVSPNLDAMRYELESVKHYSKKVK